MSKTIEVKVPDIGDFSDIPIIEVLASAGDRVAAEDGLVTLESDKATMEVPSPVAGVIREMKVGLDDTVSEGDVVAILEVGDEDSEGASPAEAEAAEVEAPEEAPTGEGSEETGGETAEEGPPAPREDREPVERGDREPSAAGPVGDRPVGAAAVDPSSVPYASPAVRRFARELGVDLTAVSGSGSKGRILREDVTAYVKTVMSGQGAAG